MCGIILLKFGMWVAEGGGHLHYENDLSSIRSTELRMHENHILVLSVNILTAWHVACMTHYRVSC